VSVNSRVGLSDSAAEVAVVPLPLVVGTVLHLVVKAVMVAPLRKSASARKRRVKTFLKLKRS